MGNSATRRRSRLPIQMAVSVRRLLGTQLSTGARVVRARGMRCCLDATEGGSYSPVRGPGPVEQRA
jgi:hypothetical protein